MLESLRYIGLLAIGAHNMASQCLVFFLSPVAWVMFGKKSAVLRLTSVGPLYQDIGSVGIECHGVDGRIRANEGGGDDG